MEGLKENMPKKKFELTKSDLEILEEDWTWEIL